MKTSILLFFIAFQISLVAQNFEQESATVKVESDSQFVKKANSAVVQYGEEIPEIEVKEGLLIESSDPLLSELLTSYIENKKIEGFKIQLFSGNNRSEADKVKSEFISKYNDESPDLVYKQPNFKIRVGNYRSRLEANKYLALYKIDFPNAFLVKDHIQLIQKKK